VCKGFQYAPEGAKCDATMFPELENVTVTCDPKMECSKVTGLCIKPVNHGISCISNDNCTAPYQCIKDKCTYKRHFGQACSDNEECHSGMCDDGKCNAKNVGEACTGNHECKVHAIDNTYLFCGTNDTCEAMAGEGEACDVTKDNCRPGLHCVTEGGVDGTCQKFAGAGADCSAAANNGKPRCQAGLECMWDESKCEALQSRAEGKDCMRGDHCAAGLACNIEEGQTVGQCAAESTVNCTSSADTKCKSAGFKGYCKCDSHDELGKCASDGKDIDVCPTENAAYTSCLENKCAYVNRGFAHPFPSDNCAATQCADEYKAYVCCAKASVVLPEEALAIDCTPPQPSEPGPGESPKDSSATGAIVSTIVVVASALAALM